MKQIKELLILNFLQPYKIKDDKKQFLIYSVKLTLIIFILIIQTFFILYFAKLTGFCSLCFKRNFCMIRIICYLGNKYRLSTS